MRTAFRTAIIFAVFFGIYLAFAGWSARSLAGDNPDVLKTWQGIRGFFAIGAGSFLVFLLTAFYARGRQNVERRLKVDLAGYRTQFDQGPLPSWIFDAETLQILAVNDAAIAEYGYDRRTLLHSQVTIFHASESHDEVIAFHRRLPAAVRASQWAHLRQNGIPLSVEIISSPTTFGERDARIAVVRDLKQIELVESALEGLLAGHSSVEKREVETSQFFQGIVDEFFNSAERSNLKLNLDVGAGIPRKMIFDTGRVSRVLEILIGDAVQLSTSGTLALHVRVKSGAPALLELALREVETAEERYRFKAPNFPVGQGRRHGFWSSLGLSLVQRLGDQLGAEIKIERDQSRCEITLLLPGEIDAHGAFVAGSPAIAAPSAS